MPNPRVIISILSWNSGDKIRDCLSSVLELDYDPFEIIVVDNGSTNSSADFIRREFPQAILLQNEQNLGFTGGHNTAIKYGLEHHADYFWLLNDDAVVEPRTLFQLVANAESSPDIGMVSPVIYQYDDPETVQYCATYLDVLTQTYKNTKQPEVAREWQESNGPVCLWGTALLIKRSLVDKIGCLDERYFAYYEDQDISIRSINAGYKNRVELSAKVRHKNPNVEILRPPHYHYLMARNEFLFWTSHLSGISKLLFAKRYMARMLGTIGKLRDNDKHESLDACLAGIWDAFNNRYGKRDVGNSMPAMLKKILVARPYLLAALLDGKLRAIFREFSNRTKSLIR